VRSDDELVGGDDRAPSPLDLTGRWQEKLAALGKKPGSLALPAFNLIRGGDLFERKGKKPRTEVSALDNYVGRKIELHRNKVAGPEHDAALPGLLRVLAGNPAICDRMLLTKSITVALIPKGDDFRRFGFPPHTNPRAAGIFWNDPKGERALIGLREEDILERPWLTAHEMMHAVHLLGMTAEERNLLDRFLMPVYLSRRGCEEAVAVYAEKAFGAQYPAEELSAPGIYAKLRREWHPDQVFSRFMRELLHV
jgi:hypothetical protein